MNKVSKSVNGQGTSLIWFGLGLWCLMPLSTIIQLNRGGGNRSIRRKPLTCHRQTLSHNIVSSTQRHEQGLNSQL